jgi:hypothetical protein
MGILLYNYLLIFRIKFDRKNDFYQGDKEMPIYSRITSGYPIGTIVSVLFKSDLSDQEICCVQPLGVTSFIVDVDVVNFEDLKADDLGTWTTTGTKTCYFRFSSSGELRISYKRGSSNLSDYYTLTRRYYIHSSYDQFHRQIVDIKGNHACT